MNRKYRVVLVDGMHGDAPVPALEEREELAAIGAELVITGGRSEDDVIEMAADADAILTYGAPMTRRVMECLPDCQCVVRYGIGYDTVDVEAATDNNVLVINIPDFCWEEVSNHALALLLACAKKMIPLDKKVKQGKWFEAKAAQSPMGSVYGQTLGIIGCGNIGRTTAKKAGCFGLEVIGYDPYLDDNIAEEHGISLVSLEELLRKSDYISIHTALTGETFHLVGEKEFALMKPSVYVINTARGPVIDEPALIKALREKRIAGAGLDVFEQEPPEPDNPLLKMGNVIALPHSASYSDEAFSRLRRSVGREAARVLGGRWPKNLVNQTVRPKKALKKD
ncbi:MAG: C-terminal binding protein [Dehalococcoidales bacterium]|nr:C-terminal binding protein [Dehalococcoidales bacterium]